MPEVLKELPLGTSAPVQEVLPAEERAGVATAFAWGDPESVLDRRDVLAYVEARGNGRWYEPPVPMDGLAKARFSSPHHASAMQYKVNQLVRHFEPTRWLDRRNFAEFALNYIAMGNGYLERLDNMAGRPLSLRNSPARWTRRGMEDDVYWWAVGWKQESAFPTGRVFHLYQPDLSQEIYGVPEWLGALQSAWLNENATLFRRRYYINGSHMGYVFYTTDPAISNSDSDKIREALRQSKGPGNFRNFYVNIPNGKEKGVQILPIGEATAKDEFLGIKETTRDDVLAAHRVPPVLLGIVPRNVGGLGSIYDAANAFHMAEIEPIMMRMLEINDWLGVEALRFREYVPMAAAKAVMP